MNGLIRFTCPSCKGQLIAVVGNADLQCENCGNRYQPRQVKNNIELILIATGRDLHAAEADQEFLQVNSGVIDGLPPVPGSEAVRVLMGECPICGRWKSQEGTFRCRNCGRSFICISHQDPSTFLCEECMGLVLAGKGESIKNQEMQSPKVKEKGSFNSLWITSIVFFCMSSLSTILIGIADGDSEAIVLGFFSGWFISFITGLIAAIIGKNKKGWVWFAWVVVAGLIAFSIMSFYFY